jgi:adenosylhomocysteinase
MPPNLTASIPCDIKDLALADSGKRRMEWTFQTMPVLQSVRKHFITTQPFKNTRMAVCLHVTSETANLAVTLRDGGAQVVVCAADPLTIQDDAAACLVKDYGLSVYAIRGAARAVFCSHLAASVESRPHLVLDEGGELSALLHARPDAAEEAFGGTEGTSIAVRRLRTMAKEGALRYPVVAVNESVTSDLFDNRYGAGQSTLDGILRSTNLLLAGMNVVVAGYGRCGRGIALRARGLGAKVIVTEVDPIRALEALMDGARVMSMGEAARAGDVFITVTGTKNAIAREHFEKFKNGAILCNAGHGSAEIDLETLGQMSSARRQPKEHVEEFALRDGRRVYVLGAGRPINLAAGEGHPAPAMDIALANQALSVEHLIKHGRSLDRLVYSVPPEIDRQVAKMKLEAMSVKIDRLTLQQEHYLAGRSEGI